MSSEGSRDDALVEAMLVVIGSNEQGHLQWSIAVGSFVVERVSLKNFGTLSSERT
jgi:hypothetical protein